MSILATLTTIIDELIRTAHLPRRHQITPPLVRPALLRLVPSLAIFDGLEAIQKVSEELLGGSSRFRLRRRWRRPRRPPRLRRSRGRRRRSARRSCRGRRRGGARAQPVPAIHQHLRRVAPHGGELLELPSFGGRVRGGGEATDLTHTLADPLITPIQRPPRCVMLLEAAVAALEKGGGDGAGGGEVALRAALEVVRDVVSALNEAARARRRRSDARGAGAASATAC